MAGNRNSGRRRDPTALKRLRGAYVSLERRTHEPKVPAATPAMPAHLAEDSYAKEEWESLIQRLTPLRVLTEADGRALALLAGALGDERRIHENWRLSGYRPVITNQWQDSRGVVRTKLIENPLLRQMRLQRALCDQLLGAFGLSPVSRAKVQQAEGTPDDDFAAFEAARPPSVLPFAPGAHGRRSR